MLDDLLDLQPTVLECGTVSVYLGDLEIKPSDFIVSSIPWLDRQ